MGIIWTIIIGFIAGVIAKFVMPGDNEPKGFILTTMTFALSLIRTRDIPHRARSSVSETVSHLSSGLMH